ncbi:MAG: hypothetical protein ACYC0T_18690 [Ramlibacter sp.]
MLHLPEWRHERRACLSGGMGAEPFARLRLGAGDLDDPGVRNGLDGARDLLAHQRVVFNQANFHAVLVRPSNVREGRIPPIIG